MQPVCNSTPTVVLDTYANLTNRPAALDLRENSRLHDAKDGSNPADHRRTVRTEVQVRFPIAVSLESEDGNEIGEMRVARHISRAGGDRKAVAFIASLV